MSKKNLVCSKFLVKKTFEFSNKISYLGIFWLKKLLPFSKSIPLRFSIWEVSCKNKKILTFRTKKALFEYYQKRIWKNHCRICLIAIFCEKKKKGWIWDEKCLIWVFLGRSLKIILSWMKSAPSNLSIHELLVIFGIGPVSSKCPGSAFSEGSVSDQGLGPGPLYKVCLCNPALYE